MKLTDATDAPRARDFLAERLHEFVGRTARYTGILTADERWFQARRVARLRDLRARWTRPRRAVHGAARRSVTRCADKCAGERADSSSNAAAPRIVDRRGAGRERCCTNRSGARYRDGQRTTPSGELAEQRG